MYRDGYLSRLTEQLGETFESVWWVLGDELYFSLAGEFIRGHRSSSHNLSDYGQEFPDFLGSAPAAAEFPFLVDLARFELGFQRLFHTACHAGLPPREWEQVDPERTRFVFGEAVMLHRADFAVSEIWKLRKGPQQSPTGMDWSRPEAVVLHKLGGRILEWNPEPGQAWILEQLEGGRPSLRRWLRRLRITPKWRLRGWTRSFSHWCAVVSSRGCIPARILPGILPIIAQ